MMKLSFPQWIATSFVLLAGNLLTAQTENYAQYVNPFVGTGGHGHTFPGATLPFGMVQLSPDTRVDGSWDGCGGYHYDDKIIYGFSHTHLSGTGCSDFGDIMLMPTVGEPSMDNKVYASAFSHLKEKAEAGYYSVFLEDDQVQADMTATLRTGLHRYTFPKTKEANIILDLLHRDKTLSCNLKVIDSVTVVGFRVSEAWAVEQHVYFTLRFSKPFKSMTYAKNKQLYTNLDTKNEEKAEGAAFRFDVSDGKPLLVKVAISPVSVEGAIKNMEAENTGWDFDKVRSDATAAWNKELTKIEVKSDNKEQLKVFYTAFYHCMIHPSTNMDVDGSYRGRDNKIHVAKGFTYYSVFSLWDTFRALNPLFTIVQQDKMRSFINTFLHQYDEGGRLPVWELASNETECMIGYHSVSVITDAFMKGIGGYDTVVIYDAMIKSSNYKGFGTPTYIANGYLQMDDEHESVSKTLEYAYDDWCIAQMAQRLGKMNDYKRYIERAQSYKNLFNPENGFMQAKKNGNWSTPFEPREVNNNYTEANSWQYSFFVPQDIDGLIELQGGPAKFEKKLDDLFSASNKTTGREQADITGLIGQYAHGNEPSHHMAYLYNFIGKPQKTVDKTTYILNEFYKDAPDGLIGNEDCGQMSAWFVFSSIGFYPVTPGIPNYILGAPLFNDVKIHLENGKLFHITRNPAGKGTNVVRSVTIDQQESLKSSIAHSQIMAGGTLEFNMSAANDSTNQYGKSLFNRPHTRINALPIVAVPVVKAPGKVFRDKMTYELVATAKELHYTLDGSEPTRKSPLYTTALTTDTSVTVKVKAYHGSDSSKTVSSRLHKIPNNWSIQLISQYNKQYTAGGDAGIIDGLYGSTNWRKGEWQGYQSQNFECVIDLGKLQEVQEFSSDYLQDTRAWIVFPTKVEYYVSNDGKKFTLAGTADNTVPAKDYDTQTKTLTLTAKSKLKARYVKVKAYNYGILPDWHQGAGGDAFIFVDEVFVK